MLLFGNGSFLISWNYIWGKFPHYKCLDKEEQESLLPKHSLETRTTRLAEQVIMSILFNDGFLSIINILENVSTWQLIQSNYNSTQFFVT